MSIFRKILNDESGATAIEYGLIAALISVAAITAFTTVGTKLSSMMTNTANSLK
jgi:pilus assembly protein Flp/PilA